MKTSFSVKVTGSITVSIEPSNEDGGGAGAADVDGGNPIVDLFLAQCMEKMINDAIKKHAKGNPTIKEEEEEDDDGDDLSSPLPQRRVPSDADADNDDDDDDDDDDDSTDDGEAEEEEDHVSELPTVQVDIDNEYEEDYHLSQKMHMMSLRSPNLLE